MCLVIFLGTGKCTFVSAEEVKEANSAIHFIDLNSPKGNATLIESIDSNNNKIYGLMDFGNDYSKNNKMCAVDKYLNTYLTDGKKLSFIILSHLDSDHVGKDNTAENIYAAGAVQIIKDYTDKNTKLYYKDLQSVYEAHKKDKDMKKRLERLKAIKNAVKTKGGTLVKVKPLNKMKSKNGEQLSSFLKRITKKNLKTKFYSYSPIEKDGKKRYTAAPTIDTTGSFTFGQYKITLYNGMDWNSISYIDTKNGVWDENVNSITAKFECRDGENNKKFTSYLNADLGENSTEQYSMKIAEKIVSSLVKNVSIYQVAHHGFYNSITEKTVCSLNCKYAIVTNSFDDIYKRSTNNGKASIAFNTIDYIMNTKITKNNKNIKKLEKVYFTGGSNFGKKPKKEFTNFPCFKAKYLNLNKNKDKIKNGTVRFAFYPQKMTVTQE